MRIALLTYSTRPRGGVVHTLSLAEALAAQGHDVDVWTLARGGDGGFFRPVDPSVTVHAVPFDERDGEDVGARIVRSMRVLGAAFDPSGSAGSAGSSGSSVSAGYDVVHAQDCISANAVPHCVRTIHHLDTFTTPELAACHERAIVRPYAHVCVSSAVAAEVRAGWGIEPVVIANGIDAERFAAGAEATGERAAWADRLGRYVLAVGGIEPRKGTADLIEAMALVQRDDPTLRLVVAGGETLFDYRDYRCAALARADELGVDLELLGVVAHERLPSLMAQATAFAFPSVKEGFGLAAMEALAASVPVVMRELPVLREVFGDTVTYATDVPGIARGLARAAGGSSRPGPGRALAARHTWAAAARAHVDFYASLGAVRGAAASS